VNPVAATVAAHISRSDLINWTNSAGVQPAGSNDCLAKLVLIASKSRPPRTAVLRPDTTSFGVPMGTNKPNHSTPSIAG
jgi:hypothetical protein